MKRLQTFAVLLKDSKYLAGVAMPDNVSERERRWEEEDEALLDSVLNNSLAEKLRGIKGEVNERDQIVGELFVTGRYGMIRASTDVTTTYSQRGERWYEEARNGSTYANFEYDASVDAMSLTVAAPIYNGSEVVGTIKAVERIEGLEQVITAAPGREVGQHFYLMEGENLLWTDASNVSAQELAFSGQGVSTELFRTRSPVTGQRTLFGSVPLVIDGNRFALVVEFEGGVWQQLQFGVLRTAGIQVVVFFLLLIGLIVAADRHIFAAIEKLNDDIDSISRGVTDEHLAEELRERGDEIGGLARSFERIMTSYRLAFSEGTSAGLEEQAEELKEKIALLEPALNELPIGVVVTDPDQDDNPMVYVGDGFVRLSGYDEDELLGRNCRLMQGDETDEETVAEIAKAIEEREPVTTVITNYRKSGERFENLLHVRPIMDESGELKFFLGVQIDISAFEQIAVVDDEQA